ncbi:hypothetical protein RB601_006036 [Gaeumannomyces tritici]
MAAKPPPSLCKYCAQIDFSILRLPTDADLEAANRGAVVDAQPFRLSRDMAAGRVRPPRWRLGSRARIERSSATCGLCAAICALVRDAPDIWSALAGHKTIDGGGGTGGLLCSAGVEGTVELHPLPGKGWEASTGYYRCYRLGLDWWTPRGPDDLELPPGHVGGEYSAAAVGPAVTSAVDCFQTYGGSGGGGAEGGRPQFGGRIRPPMVDMSLPKRWLNDCIEGHGGECQGWAAHQADGVVRELAAPALPRLLRLIDTRSKRLVEFENPMASHLHYAALSYVWGEKQRIVLLSSNHAALQLPHCLDGEVASPTIQDAIQFVAALGIPYIWVDALCIMQDSAADKAVQIGAMAAVYACAAVTVVAAAGPDAGSRLPGVREPRTRKQTRVRVGPDVELLTSLSPLVARAASRSAIPGDAHVLNSTAWATRGWTLQERAVSRRLLAFTPDQLVWSCPALAECEETECSSSSSPGLAVAKFDALGSRTPQRLSLTERFANGPSGAGEEEDGRGHFWYAFQHLVLDFSSRALRFPGDAHDAFGAVLAQAAAMTGDEFVWALPAGQFALALTWTPWREGLRRRGEVTTLPATTLNREVPFPSWSWLGWTGRVQYRIGEQVEAGLEPNVVCYTIRHAPSIHLQRIGGAADVPAPKAPKTPPTTVTLQDIQQHLPQLGGSAGLSNVPDNQMIFFWAECAYFNISARLDMGRGIFMRFVYDANGVNVGRISPCREDTQEEDPETAHRRFVLLATSKQTSIPSEKIVLMLQLRDEVWFRSDMAVIEEDGWLSADPKSELVGLA